MKAVGTGSTNLPDPRAAATHVVEQALKGLAGKPTLAILLATVDYDLDVLVGTVRECLGEVPLWGGTSSSGVFTRESWLTGEKGAAALMLLTGRPAGAGAAPIGSDPVEAGRLAAAAALRQAGGSANVALTIPAAGQEAEMLAGIGQVMPGAPVVGGASGEHGTAGTMRQFANGYVYQNAFSVAAIGGENLGCAFTHGYHPTGKTAVMTEVAGHRLVSLDGRPALEVYEEWTGLPSTAVMGGQLMMTSTRYPLTLRVNGSSLAIHPVNGREDGGMDTGVELPPGMTVELMQNTLDGIIGEVEHVVRLAAEQVTEPQAVFLAHCAGRALALGERISEVPAQVRKAVGDVPLVGFLAYGEQGCPYPKHPMHGNLSLSALVIGRV